MNHYYPLRTDQLVNASLDLLLSEAQSWLSDFEFWKDEMNFFSKFLDRNKAQSASASGELKELVNEHLRISRTKLETIGKEIEDHEAGLTILLLQEGDTLDESYRQRHQMVSRDMHHLHTLIRNFKKNVFLYASKHVPGPQFQ